MNKLKLFTENFIIYGLGGVISKIIPLIMVPIVTRIMPTSDYFGISDLNGTIVSFACALTIMGMFDAMFRMFFDNDEESHKKTVCSTTLAFTLTTSTVIFLLMLIFREPIAEFFFSDKKYEYVVFLSATATLVSSTNAIIAAPTRMQNKRSVFLIVNTVSPILSYAIAVPLLFKGYYVIALPLSGVVSGITVEIAFGLMNRKWFDLKFFDRKLLKELLIFAIPLAPNILIYWLFNSCDKVMITNMIGIGAAGVYSVGSKLGHASQLIYTAFSGGWQYFAFSTMNEENQVDSNSRVFEYLGVISFVATAFICAWSFSIYKFLFPIQYLSGYIVAPYIFLAPLLQMLFQVIANQFLVIKKTWPSMLILLSGAVFNVVINFFMIPVLGIEGAALATLFGYIVTDIICVIVLCNMKLLVVSRRFIASVMLMAGFFLIWRCLFSRMILVSTLMAVLYMVVEIGLYKGDLRLMIDRAVHGSSDEK